MDVPARVKSTANIKRRKLWTQLQNIALQCLTFQVCRDEMMPINLRNDSNFPNQIMISCEVLCRHESWPDEDSGRR